MNPVFIAEGFHITSMRKTVTKTGLIVWRAFENRPDERAKRLKLLPCGR